MAKYKRISMWYLVLEKSYTIQDDEFGYFSYFFNTETTRAPRKSSVRCMREKKRYWYYLLYITHVYKKEWWPLIHLTSHTGRRTGYNKPNPYLRLKPYSLKWHAKPHFIDNTNNYNNYMYYIASHLYASLFIHHLYCQHHRRHHHHRHQPHYHRTIKLVLPVISNKPLDTFWNPWIASIA